MNVASSVYFVTLVVAQMGHLLSVRSKTPYFAEWLCGSRCGSRTGGEGRGGEGRGGGEGSSQPTDDEEKDEPVVGPLHDTTMGDDSDPSGQPVVMATSVTSPPPTAPNHPQGCCDYIRWSIILAWFGSIATALIFTEVPFIQRNCGTGSVPSLYWGIAVGWSVLFFVVAEIRKWLFFLFPNTKLARWLSW